MEFDTEDTGMEDEVGEKIDVDAERPLPFTIDPDSLEVMLTKKLPCDIFHLKKTYFCTKEHKHTVITIYV